MSINWIALVPQVSGLAVHGALQQAEPGGIPWTGPLAREWNGRWLKEHAPDGLAEMPGLVEEAHCECGGGAGFATLTRPACCAAARRAGRSIAWAGQRMRAGWHEDSQGEAGRRG